MKFFTIGYGGRSPDELAGLLRQNGVVTVVDVRLHPDRAYSGTWKKAKTPDKGIEKVLSDAGIGYVSLVELGNPFLNEPDWEPRYRQLLEESGDQRTRPLESVPQPFCLLCAEKRVAECHRGLIAEYLVRTKGAGVQHLE